MKSKNKKWGALLLAVILVSALVISGCSSNKKEGGGNVELKLGFYSSAQSDEKMQELIAKFEEKHPNIKVKTESSPYNQFFQKLDTQIAAESAPDLWLSDGVLVPKYAERGVLKDLTEWIQRDLKSDEYYGLDFNKDAEGKYWGVPQGIQIAVLYYNKDMFDEAQVDYPTEDWTWDDLKAAAEKLTKDSQPMRQPSRSRTRWA